MQKLSFRLSANFKSDAGLLDLRRGPMSRIATALLSMLILLLLGWCSSLLVQMGNDAWPSLHSDSILYLTPAVNDANDAGHRFAVFLRPYLYKGNWEFDFHGQLYQFVLAAFTHNGTPSEFVRTMGWLNVATLVAGFLAIFTASRCDLRLGVVGSLMMGAAGGVAAVTVALSLQGRPEHLVPLLLSLFSLARKTSGNRARRAIIDSLEIGLIAAMSAAPAMLLALLRTFERAVDPRARNWAFEMGGLALGSLLVWGATIALVSPVSPVQLLYNIATFYSTGGLPRGYSILHEVWFLSPQRPLLGMPFLVFALAAVARVRRSEYRGVRRGRCVFAYF